MPALPFITLDPASGQFSIDNQAAEFLERLDAPLAVVACAGKYRTGKSSLLNRVLLDVDGREGFGVGKTVNACTKGLWLHTKVLGVPRDDGSTLSVLVVDSEGLGAFSATDSHDSRIFALALLVSSFFVYNSVGTIDEQAISTLSLVANISKHVRARANEAGVAQSAAESELSAARELGSLFPDFLWVVRDFSLQLCAADGAALNANQYLEQALAPKTAPANASSEQTAALEEKNHLRALLRTYFPRRQCATVVRPCTNERDLQRVDSMPKSEMRAEFWQDATAVRSAILRGAPAKTVENAKPISGRGLLRLCRSFVDALNSGAAPVIRDSWALLAEVQFRDAIDAAHSAFCKVVERESGDGACDPQTLQSVLQNAERHAAIVFNREAPDQSGPQHVKFGQKLASILRDSANDARETNSRLMQTHIDTVLSRQVTSRVHQCRSWNEFIEDVWQPARDAVEEQLGSGREARVAWSCAALPALESAAATLVDASSAAQRELEQVSAALRAAKEELSLVAQERDEFALLREKHAALEAQAAVATEEAQRRERELSAKIEQAVATRADTQNVEQSEAWRERESQLRSEAAEAMRAAEARAAEAEWQLQEANERVERTTNAFTDQIEALKRETSASLDEIRAAAREELQATVQRCEKLQIALDEAQSVAERAQEKSVLMKRKHGEALVRAETAETALASLRTENSAAERAMNEKWRADLQASADAKIELTRALKEAEARLAAREVQVAALRAELDEEKPNVEAERAWAVRERVEREADALRAELIETRAEMVKRNAEIRSLENRLRDQQSEHAMAQIKLKMDYEVQTARSRAHQTAATSNAVLGTAAAQKRAKIV